MNPPAAYLIGLAKCGTTFVRGYLEKHPEIILARSAHHFMMPQERYEAGHPFYLREFEKPKYDGKYVIDCCETLGHGFVFDEFDPYASDPCLVPGGNCVTTYDPHTIIDRIRGTFGHRIKIILIIRNQIDMLRSVMKWYRDDVPSPVDFMQTETWFRYVKGGMYHSTVSNWSSRFESENMIVIPLEWMKMCPDSTMQWLLFFLGVSEGKPYAQADQVGNRNAGVSNKEYNLFALRNKYPGIWMPPSLVLPFMSDEILPKKIIESLHGLYAASNQATSGQIGFNLKDFGYPIGGEPCTSERR